MFFQFLQRLMKWKLEKWSQMITKIWTLFSWRTLIILLLPWIVSFFSRVGSLCTFFSKEKKESLLFYVFFFLFFLFYFYGSQEELNPEFHGESISFSTILLRLVLFGNDKHVHNEWFFFFHIYTSFLLYIPFGNYHFDWRQKENFLCSFELLY